MFSGKLPDAVWAAECWLDSQDERDARERKGKACADCESCEVCPAAPEWGWCTDGREGGWIDPSAPAGDCECFALDPKRFKAI